MLFFNTLYIELALLCLLHAPVYTAKAGGRRNRPGAIAAAGSTTSAFTIDASTFNVSLVTALTQGVVVAALTMWVTGLMVYVFQLSNSRRRSPPMLRKRLRYLYQGCCAACMFARQAPSRIGWRMRRCCAALASRVARRWRKVASRWAACCKRNDRTAPPAWHPTPLRAPPPTPSLSEASMERSATTSSSESLRNVAAPVTCERSSMATVYELRQLCFDRKIYVSISDTVETLEAKLRASPPPSPPLEKEWTNPLPSQPRLSSVCSADAASSTQARRTGIQRSLSMGRSKALLVRSLTMGPSVSPRKLLKAPTRAVQKGLTGLKLPQHSRPSIERSKTGMTTARDLLSDKAQRTSRALSEARIQAFGHRTMVAHARRGSSSELAIVALAAQVRQRKQDVLWRSDLERSVRHAAAWLFNLAASAILLFYALVISIKFGEEETNGLFTSWGVAYLFTALIFDPCNIVIVSLMPCFINEETSCGQCAQRVKFVYDELFAP